jgi:hypothetical protein
MLYPVGFTHADFSSVGASPAASGDPPDTKH